MRKILFVLSILFLISYQNRGLCDKKVDPKLEMLANYNINFGDYLVDVGKYLEALESYETAFESSRYPKTKAKALLREAMLFATFLDKPDKAIDIYNRIFSKYPQYGELALYKKGLLLFSLSRYKEAVDTFSLYLKAFPRGKNRISVEILKEKAKQELKKAKPKKKPAIKRPKIRVAIFKKINKFEVFGDGMRVVDDSGKIILEGKKRLIFAYKDGNISANGKVIKRRSVYVKSRSFLKIVSTRKKKTVRGKLYIMAKSGYLRVINILDIEEYLFSVVPSESYASWAMETLKAQAVAARTYALYQILHRKKWDYDVVDYEGDQSYRGVERENERTTKAVLETEGLVLVYKKRPILAMYTANNGGFIADPYYVFGIKLPYMVCKADRDSLFGRNATWRKSYRVEEIEKRLSKVGFPIRGIKEIKPYFVSPSGRIIKIKITYDKRSVVVRTRSTIGRALKLPEILVKIEKVDGKFLFYGKGWGHGVGYSQEGGAVMGKKLDFRKILSFYYPGARLEKEW